MNNIWRNNLKKTIELDHYKSRFMIAKKYGKLKVDFKSDKILQLNNKKNEIEQDNNYVELCMHCKYVF